MQKSECGVGSWRADKIIVYMVWDSGTRKEAAKGDDAIFMALHGPEWYGQGPACIEADKRRLWIGVCISLHLSAGLCISPRLSASLCISLRLSAYLCMALHVSIWLCMSLYGSACLCMALHVSAGSMVRIGLYGEDA
jgi:hypothetical protein